MASVAMAAAMVSELKSTVCPAVCLHGGQCGLDRALPAELLTEAGHDEQAEVDGETQSEGDDQVEGKDRQRQSHDDQTHDAQGDGDGEHRTEQRHGGGA